MHLGMTKNTIAPVLVLLMLIAAGGYMMLNNDGNDSNAPGDGDGPGDGSGEQLVSTWWWGSGECSAWL